MIENLRSRSELKGFARRQGRSEIWRTVKSREADELLASGWEVRRKNKKSVSLKQPKPAHVAFESRVWTLLYKMGFPLISGDGGAKLYLGRDGAGPTQQIDCVVVDDEVALAVECKSYSSQRKDSAFSEKLTKLASIRNKFARGVAQHSEIEGERSVATVMFTMNLLPRESDLQRAAQESVRIFEEQDIDYYEALVKHLGSAARYQFLAEVFKGRLVKGLKVRIPALKARVGKTRAYTFAIRPDYLLKIAYVAHRAKGKPFDVDAYQRMISKTRLKKIADFISNDGVFPTNIVVNVEDSRHLRFDPGSQTDDEAGAIIGWLTLTPAYGTAWIIDGQHRLFGYSGHDRAPTSFLNVVAFEGLSPAEQTELFVEINSEQRRVKRSLLVELDATLKWDDEDEDKRIHAVVSKAGMALDGLQDSPLRGRILLADVRRTKKRCISLTALAGALRKPGFYIVSRKKGQATQYGPLWRDNPDDALRRTVAIVKEWLAAVAAQASDWWKAGSDEGGGLAMNDGVTVCIDTLRGVLDHLNQRGNLVLAETEDLVERLAPYAHALGEHFARMSAEERKSFRALRGVQGQTTGRMMVYESLAQTFSTFKPEGLEDWLERRKANTNEEARKIIDRIERAVQARVLEELKSEYQVDDDDWWFSGVPKAVRKKVDDRINEMGGGKREESFDLLHYEAIIHHQWEIFKPLFALGEKSNIGKDKGTAWLRDVGDMRNKVMHPSRNDFLSLQELQTLQSYEDRLTDSLASHE